jgi:hypothetical protein
MAVLFLLCESPRTLRLCVILCRCLFPLSRRFFSVLSVPSVVKSSF